MNNPAVQSPPPQPGPAWTRTKLPRPWVVIVIMALTGFVFVLQNLSIYILGDDYLILLGEKSNSLIIQGQIWRLVTPLLLHGSLIHIGFNLYALLIIGPGLERYFGRMRFLLLYLLGGIAGNLASFYFSADPSIGASTAIFGLIAAQGVFIYRNREFFGAQARPMLINTLIIIAINLFLGASLPGIDNWGHLGGLIGGFAYAWFAGPLLKRQTVLLDYGGSSSQAYPSLETPLPQYAVRLVDQVTQNRVWLAAAIELAVLGVLTIIRMMRLS
ncbi:MAG TPA: rhomboid family intramembrane serine protease [Anaerolineaceae bacterium]|jgi:rhomboid protease GluP